MHYSARKAQKPIKIQNEDSIFRALGQQGSHYSRRQLRGLGILVRGEQITKISNDVFKVRSQSSSHAYGVVKVANKWTCSCPDFTKKLKPCKHIFAITFLTHLPEIVAANGLWSQGIQYK